MKYANSLYLINLDDVSKSIFEIGQAYMKRIYDDERIMNVSKRPADTLKLFYFLYLTGARVGEALREPFPKIVATTVKGFQIIEVSKTNEKHFKNKRTDEREIMVANLPIDNIYDLAMWDCITDNGTNYDCSRWLKSFGGYSQRNVVTNKFKRCFYANMTDDSGVKYEHHSINPHILRHLRTFNLLVNKNYAPRLVQSIFGHKDTKMQTYYSYIKRALSRVEQQQLILPMLQQRAVTENMRFKIGSN